MSCADFCGWLDGAQRQSMRSVGEVTAEEEREKFLCTQPELNGQPLAYETRMVPQEHCQCTTISVPQYSRETNIGSTLNLFLQRMYRNSKIRLDIRLIYNRKKSLGTHTAPLIKQNPHDEHYG
jgi:hypothetical protein